MSTAARLYRSMSRGARARKGAGIPLLAEQYDYANWRETCAKLADDPEATAALYEIGRDQGWVTDSGTLVPPGTEPPSADDEMNAAIRRAAGRESSRPWAGATSQGCLEHPSRVGLPRRSSPEAPS